MWIQGTHVVPSQTVNRQNWLCCPCGTCSTWHSMSGSSECLSSAIVRTHVSIPRFDEPRCFSAQCRSSLIFLSSCADQIHNNYGPFTCAARLVVIVCSAVSKWYRITRQSQWYVDTVSGAGTVMVVQVQSVAVQLSPEETMC